MTTAFVSQHFHERQIKVAMVKVTAPRHNTVQEKLFSYFTYQSYGFTNVGNATDDNKFLTFLHNLAYFIIRMNFHRC